MQIESTYSFFFHPFHERHSRSAQLLSIITTIALAILTSGLYLIIFASMNLETLFPNYFDNSKFVGVEALKEKQASHLKKLQTLASNNQWEDIGSHTTHKDSGFDWWMFVLNKPSNQYKQKYQATLKDIQALKHDSEFMENYRQGIKLVLRSWGWNADHSTLERSPSQPKQIWRHYPVRLAKMIQSLHLFEETKLLNSIARFVDQEKIWGELHGNVPKLLQQYQTGNNTNFLNLFLSILGIGAMIAVNKMVK